MDSRKRSIQNLFYSSLGQVVTLVMALVIPRLFVVSYGSEVNGLLNSLSQFLICLNLFEAGVGDATQKALYGPVKKGDWDAINGVLSATNQFYRKTGRWYLIALIALSLGYPLFVESDLSYWTICGAFFFSGIGNVVLFYFQGKYRFLLLAEGKNYLYANLSTIINIAVNMSKVILIYLGADVVTILAISFLITSVQAVYVIWYIRKYYQKLNLNVEPDYDSIKEKDFALVHQIGGLVFNNTDVIILTVFCGLKVVSVYSMFKLVVAHLDQILAIFLNSIKFILGQTYNSDLERYKRMIDLTDSLYNAIVYAVYAVAYFMFLPFMALYTQGVTDINYVDDKLPILFVTIALASHTRTPLAQTINFAGHFKQTTPQCIAETVINLAVSLIAVNFFGIYGVLVGTIIALAYRTNETIIYVNRRLLYRTPWRSYGIYAVNIAVLVVSNWLFGVLFGGIVMDSYLKLLLVAACCGIIAIILFPAAQMICFPHCREGLKDLVARKKAK